MVTRGTCGRLLIKRPFSDLTLEQVGETGLKRTLGPLSLFLMGLGCIVGAGIYIVAGNAAAYFAGPAVIVSFCLAALACCFTALCYAELASSLPFVGSAYTYSYVAIGESVAWLVGWMLMLEYGVAGAAISIGVSSLVVNLLADAHIYVAPAISSPLFLYEPTKAGVEFRWAGSINLIAVGAVAVGGWFAARDVSRSAVLASTLVGLKLGVLLLFLAVGAVYVNHDNWVPFVPPSEGGMRYGVLGIIRATPVIFFAYLGFEAVSAAAGEARNPQRDLPIALLGALATATVLYIAIAVVMTGVVRYPNLGGPAPIAYVASATGLRWLSLTIQLGAIPGMFAALLIALYSGSRVLLALSRDGLISPKFKRLHRQTRAPSLSVALLSTVVALASAALPIQILTDIVSIGTVAAFMSVCWSVIRLRASAPELVRPFRIPGGIAVPIAGLLSAFLMSLPVLYDLARAALHGSILPGGLLLAYSVLGVGIYALYGYSHSRHANRPSEVEDRCRRDGASASRPYTKRRAPGDNRNVTDRP